MADRRLTYKIGLEADNKQFLTQINQAIEALNKLSTSSATQVTTQLQDASRAALELSVNLQKSVNTETGKFDLLAFNNNLKKQDQSIAQYAARLRGAGEAGEEAFYKVARAITSAELPIKRSSKLLDSLWTTMKNTMRWQLTSTALRTFIGGLQTAYGYAQDLNESLNKIQIVTKNSTEDMAAFAKQANEAAKSLSTTTTKYANASLIYYQQGLKGTDVQERTDATVKYANVADISAEQASEQLTSIWNNFYDGSKSLEYYIDVMAKLGATTASSSSEISEGMQKFAAVAGTVGLSYEYAAAALATITATTRESADIVGTSLRTLFARIESLKLGDTLEDGTDLGKYSEALAKVGVNIKTVSGDLKDMDVILEELGSRWQSLSRDQQMALAQTVAGVRQYTQLITLMDNWDFFQQNLVTARGSEGELAKQAEIYAKSWEAARNRVKAAAEDIYDSLVNPKFFTDLDDKFTPILTGIANTVDSFGGLGGIITSVLGLVQTLYSDKIAESMRGFAENIGISTGYYRDQLRILQEQTAEAARDTLIGTGGEYKYVQAINVTMKEGLALKQLANKESDKLNNAQRELLNYQMEQVKQLEDQLNLQVEQARVAKQTADTARENIRNTSSNAIHGGNARLNQAMADRTINDTELRDFVGTGQVSGGVYANMEKILGIVDRLAQQSSALQSFIQVLQQMGETADYTEQQIRDIAEAVGLNNTELVENLVTIANSTEGTEKWDQMIRALRYSIRGMNADLDTTSIALRALGASGADVDNLIQSLKKFGLTEGEIGQLIELVTQKQQEQTEVITQGTLRTKDWADTLQVVGTALFSMSAASRGLKSLLDVFDNKNITSAERMTQVLTTISMLLPTILKLVKDANVATTITAIKNAYVATSAQAAAAGSKAFAAGLAGVGAAAQAALPLVGLVATGLVLLWQGVEHSRQKAEEQKQALRDETYEIAEAAVEEVKSNQELIQSMQSLLKSYQETGSGKDELDKVSRQLADAYNVEGAALAKLSGKYENYNTLLQNVINQRTQDLADERKKISDAQIATEEEIESKFRKQRNSVTNGYRFAFSGSFDQEREAADILSRELTRAGFTDNSTQAFQGQGVELLLSSATADDFMRLYDVLGDVEQQVKALYGQEWVDSGTLADVIAYRDAIGELVDEHREYAKEMDSIDLQLGQGLTRSDINVSNLDEYKQWVQETTAILQQKYSDDEIASIINGLVSDSPNTKIQGLKDMADAIDEIRTLLGPNNPLAAGNYLESAFSSEWMDKDVLASLNWVILDSVESFQKAYAAAKLYSDAIKDAGENSEKLQNVSSALDDFNKDKTPDASTYEKLRAANIDWGDGEYETFLAKSREEQIAALQQYVKESREIVIEGDYETIQRAQEQIEEYKRQLSTISDNEREELSKRADEWHKLQNAVNEYQASLKSGAQFDWTKYFPTNYDWTKYFNGVNFQQAVLTGGQKVADAIKQGVAQADAKIETIEVAESGIQACKEQIETSLSDIQIQAELSFKENISAIENSVGKLSAVYDMLAKKDNITKTVNEAGESVLTFGANAVSAISSIYPGFTQMGQVLKDGTLELTEEMYNDFFFASENSLAADTASKVGMLENLKILLKKEIEDLESKRQIAKAKMEAGVNFADLETTEKEGLLDGYEKAEKASNGTLLKDQVNTLTTKDTNFHNFWQSVVGYSASAADDMSNNIANATDNMITNLGKIQAAAFATMQQVAAIGSKAGDETFQDYGIDIGGADRGIKTDTTINDLRAALSDTRVEAGSTMAERQQRILDKQRRRAQSDELYKLYDQELANGIANLSKQYDTATIAQQTLLGSLQSAMDAAEKATKGSGSSKNAKTEALKELTERADKYHEINQELEYQDFLLKKIENDMKRASTPAESLKLYEQKLDVINKQLALTKEKVQQAFNYMNEDVVDIGLSGFEIEIDPDSLAITNWEEIYNPLRDAVNAKKIEFNQWVEGTYRGSTGQYDEQKSLLEQDIKDAEQVLELFKKRTKAYEDDRSEYFKVLNEEAELENTLYDLHKEAVKEQIRQLATVADRYHEVTREINRQQTAIDSLGESIQRAFGTKRLDDYSKKLDAINKQIKNYETEYNEAFNYAQSDYDMLKAAGINAQLDPVTHEILNYDEIIGPAKRELESYYSYYTDLMKQVNSVSEEGQKEIWNQKKEEAERHLSNLEFEYNKVKDLVEQYESSLDKIEEARNAWKDMWRELEDTKLNEIVDRLNNVLQVKNVEKAARSFSKAIAESFGDVLTHGETGALLDYENAKLEASKYTEYMQQYVELKELAAEAKVFEDGESITDVQAIIDQVEDLQGKVIESGEALLEWIDSLEHLLPDAIDAAAKRLQQFTDQLDHNTSIADLVGELYALQGVTVRTEEGYARLQAATQERLDAALAKSQIQKTWFDGAKQELAEAQAALDQETEGTVAYDILKANRDALLEQFKSAQKEYLSAAKEAYTAAQEMYERAMEKTYIDAQRRVTGGTSFDIMQDKYDNYIESQGRYLDNINELYEVNAWNMKLQEAIDNTQNKQHKEVLKNLQEEIDLRRRGQTLSKYDLEILNAKYEMALKQMALEDAQNNRNQMKLVRDSNGNWNYQYFADEDQIAQAKQEFLNAENNYYNIAKQQVQDTAGEIISLTSEMYGKIKDLRREDFDNEEDYNKEVERIKEYYLGRIEDLETQKKEAIVDMNAAALTAMLTFTAQGESSLVDMKGNSIPVIQEFSATTIKLFEDIERESGIKLSETDKQMISILTSMGISSQQILDGIKQGGIDSIYTMGQQMHSDMTNIKTDLNEIETDWENDFAQHLGEDGMTGYVVDLRDNTEQYLDEMKSNWEEYQNTIADVADKTDTKLDDLDDTLNEVSESTDRVYEAGLDAAEALMEQLSAAQEATWAYAELAEQIMGVVYAMEQLAAAQAITVGELSQGIGVGNNVVGLPNKNIVDTTQYDVDWGSLMAQAVYRNDYEFAEYLKGKRDSSYHWSDSSLKDKENWKDSTVIWNEAEAAKQNGSVVPEYAYDAFKNRDKTYAEWKKLMGFATGGYTGEFEGDRLGILHQKELVLNQEDTKNILSAVAAVRSFTPDVFSQIEKVLDGTVIGTLAQLASSFMSARVPDTSSVVEQDVKIEANFPNVTQSTEIQDALMGLVNEAAQYARKRTE